MRTTQDIQVLEAMQRYGGSFAAKLGEAATLADGDNMQRIKGAFPEIWEQYSELARMLAERQKARTA